MSDLAMNVDHLLDLADAACDEIASEHDFVEMDTILRADQPSRSRYLNYCWMHAALKLELRANLAVQKACRKISAESAIVIAHDSNAASAETPSAMPFGFLPTALHGTVGYFSSGWPVAYLIATVIFGIGAWIGAVTYVSHPVQVARESATIHYPLSTIHSSVVGRITGMVDCRWERKGLGIRDWGLAKGSRFKVQGSQPRNFQSPIPNPQSLVCLGDKIALAAGLMEITYATGAKVILQGPATYKADSSAGGYLSLGKLTARLEKRGEGRGERGEKVASGQWLVAGKSEIRNQKSEISNPQSQIPNLPLSTTHYPRFTIKTPTATVTDLGTEFGVEVDTWGRTTSHVFRGLVRVQAVAADGRMQGEGQLLRENESARVERRDGDRAVVVVPSTKAAEFIRQIPKLSIASLDLVDIVAGGDGFSGRRDRGIDPVTGRIAEAIIPDLPEFPAIAGNGFHRCPEIPLVDGVFVADGTKETVQIDSAGHVFDGFRGTINLREQHIWAGGSMQGQAYPTKVGDVDYAARGHGQLLMHASNGITFDLEAIRRANAGCRLLRFAAAAADADFAGRGLADIWVLVDGKVQFQRWRINGKSGVFSIVVPIHDKDRFLTLAATDGGDGTGYDAIMFGDPRLEMLAIETNREE